jgi:hypothetical protein
LIRKTNYYMFRSIILSFLLWLSLEAASAQIFYSGIHLQAGIPLRELQNKADGIIFPEVVWSGLYQLPNKPLEIGLGLGYGVYGSNLEIRNDLYAGQNDRFRLRRNNNLLTIMGMLRFVPYVESKIQPFMEAQLGGAYMYTRFKIREHWYLEPVEQGLDQDDWTLAYRFGGGIKIPFKKPENGHFEIRVLYQESSPVSFLRKQDTEYLPQQGDGEFSYSPQRSPLFMIQPGIAWVFNISH